MDAEEERRKSKRALSPTLPDGDLPSYMKATESYFKKVHTFSYMDTNLATTTHTIQSTQYVNYTTNVRGLRKLWLRSMPVDTSPGIITFYHYILMPQ